MARADADNTRPVVTPGRMVAAVGACFVGAYLSLSVPFLGVTVAAAALAWLWYRGRPLVAVATAVVCGMATIVIDPAGPIYVTPWLLAAGPLTAVLFRRRSITSVVLVVSLLMIAVWLVLLGTLAVVQGTTIQGYMRTMITEATKPAMAQVAGTAAGTAEAKKQIQEITATFTRVWPAIIAVMSLVTALLSVCTVAVVARLSGVQVNGPPDLAGLDLSPHVVWGLIIGGGMLAADKFLGGWNGGVLGIVGENLLRVTQWVLFIQGVAVFAGLYKKAGFSRLSKGLGYVLLGITEMFLPLVSLTGLVDMFANVRKLPRDAVASAATSEGGTYGPSGGDGFPQD